jgi:hypothetical protein
MAPSEKAEMLSAHESVSVHCTEDCQVALGHGKTFGSPPRSWRYVVLTIGIHRALTLWVSLHFVKRFLNGGDIVSGSI